MATSWHPEEGVAATPDEVDAMARVLEARHGSHAAEIAEFFALAHGQKGDAPRAWAWNGVAETIKQRTDQRLGRAEPASDEDGPRPAGVRRARRR
jgi:hypothetical protein